MHKYRRTTWFLQVQHRKLINTLTMYKNRITSCMKSIDVKLRRLSISVHETACTAPCREKSECSQYNGTSAPCFNCPALTYPCGAREEVRIDPLCPPGRMLYNARTKSGTNPGQSPPGQLPPGQMPPCFLPPGQ